MSGAPLAPSARLAEPLSRVLGARTAGALAKLELETVGDLVRHYPRRYGSPGHLSDLAGLEVGVHVTVVAEVQQVTVRPMRARGGSILEAIVSDGAVSLSLTFFAKRAGALRAHEDRLRPGRTGLFTGTVGEYRGRRQLTHPDYAIIGVDAATAEDAVIEASRPIPLYPASASVPTWRIARAVRAVLDPLREEDVPDPVPAEVRLRRGLSSALDALRDVHVPEDDAAWMRGSWRLRYEEAFVLQAALALRRMGREAERTLPRDGGDGALLAALDARLPFPLTDGQRAVGGEIAADLARPTPMMRLLQGDVGSGKTVVALRAMLAVVDSGGQAALLAPTEVLASQHWRTLRSLLGPLAESGTLGAPARATRVALLTGALGGARERQALADAASGAAGIVVGTHSLLSERVQFADLGLVVVDEQHRFGVEQRAALRTRGSTPAHVLVMTATPIPRTVAMTVFGDLDVSTLAERPAERGAVETHRVPADNAEWVDRVWSRVREEVERGGRAYVVCSRIDAAQREEAVAEQADAVAGAASVGETAAALRRHPALAGIAIGEAHGRMAQDEREAALEAFATGATPVLVATTVVEVGLDVPDASVMVVMDADQFGISQLHQLRGRVGRSERPAVCLLISSAAEGSIARRRLDAVVATTDGFALAEADVELRREGDVLGSVQSGGRNSLRLLRVVRDADIIALAREDAAALVEADPALERHEELRAAVAPWRETDQGEFLDKS